MSMVYYCTNIIRKMSLSSTVILLQGFRTGELDFVNHTIFSESAHRRNKINVLRTFIILILCNVEAVSVIKNHEVVSNYL